MQAKSTCQSLTTACAAGLMALTTACSSQGPTKPPIVQLEQKVFSAADKQAATALSIGNAVAVKSAGSPYDQALLCTAALQTLDQRFKNSSLLNSTQTAALRQIQTKYETQLSALGKAKNINQSAIRDAIAQTVSTKEPAVLLQAAVSCLKQMQ